jgi:hypothetical protein
VGVAKGENIAGRSSVKSPSISLSDQPTLPDIRTDSKNIEVMLKRIFEIAQIVANAPSPGLEVSDQDHQVAQKHSSQHLQ